MAISKFVIASAICISSIGSAFADEALTNWTGFYLGANLGYGHGDSDVSTSSVFSSTGYFATTSIPAISNASNGNVSPSGIQGGVNLGYNFQSGKIVFGGEIDLDAVDAKDSRTSTATYPCCAPTSFSNTQTVQADWLLTARARVGYAFDQSLVYITGGLAAAKIKSSNHFTDTFATANETTSSSDTKYGWVLGAGYERSLENNWSVKAEYLHTDLNDVTNTSNNLTAFTPAISFPTNTFTNKADLSFDIIRFGILKRF